MVEIDEANFFVCVIFLPVLIFTFYFLRNRGQCNNLPPGPTTYPFVGNLTQFVGRNFIKTLKKFRKEYGNIFTVEILGRRIIVIGGYENIKEVFVKRGSEFADRPPIPNTPFEGHGVVFANGEIWKHNRRFAIHTLREFGMGRNQLQSSIHDEIGHFLDAIEEHGGEPFDIKDLLNLAICNVISCMVFGRRFDYHGKYFLTYVQSLDEIVRTSSFTRLSWLKHIPGDPSGAARSYRLLMFLQDFFKRHIDDHLRNFDTNNIHDLTDAYIKQMKGNTEAREASLMNADNLVRIVHDLFGTGTETTTSTLRYGLLYLLHNPDIQTRLSNDIQNNVPNQRLPNLSDKPNLTYLDATIYEILRRSCLMPFSGPHLVTTETEFKGYKLPKSAMLFPDTESVLMDDVLWDDPQSFNPSRFLDGNLKIINTEHLIPFSVGPRACLGEGLGKMELYLFLSAMLQRFTFLPPEGETPPIDIVWGHVCSPKPFKLRAIKN